MKRSISWIISLMILIAAPASGQKVFRWPQGGTGNAGPYGTNSVIYSDGVKFMGLTISSTVGDCLKVTAGPALGWGTCGGGGGVTGSGTLNLLTYWTGTTSLGAITAGTTGQPLLQAAPPAFGALNLAGGSTIVSGVLPNANTTATSADTASSIVARDSGGDFAAGTIKATIFQGGTVRSAAGFSLSLYAQIPLADATSQPGVDTSLSASDAIAGLVTASAAAGGNVNITSGAAKQLTSGDANGGDISLNTGTGVGTGTQGRVLVNGNPVGTVTSITTTTPVTGCSSPCTSTATIGVSDMVAAGGSHAAGVVPDPGVTTHSPAYYLGDDATFHSVLTAIPTARYELSTTAANGVTSTFSFPVAVTSVTTVFVGGVAQTPSDISISGGNIVLGVNIAPPPAGVEVSALYNGTVSGTGSVTSVGATGPSGLLTWSNTPITTSGTLTAALNSQSAHTFLGGLTSGSGTPAFRLLDPSDVPPSQGGTGANNTATSGRYLKGDGTNFVTSSGSASGVGSCTNQVVVGLNSDASPTCASISLAYGAGVDVQVYNTPGTHTWTKPVNASFVLAECWGSGGGGASGGTAVGGGSPQAITSGGGGGGAYSHKTFKASALGSTETVTVAAGGTGGASSTYGSSGAHNGNPGGNGATSSFGTKLKAGGGARGQSDSSNGPGGGGGGVIGDAADQTGGAPSAPNNTNAISGQGASAQTNGSAAEYGGGAGSQGSASTPGGGDSIYGSGGGGRGGSISAVFVCTSPSAGGGVGTYGIGNGAAAGTSNSGSSGAVTGTAGTDGATVNESGTGGGGGGSACDTGASGSATGGAGGKGGAPGGGGGGGGSARFDFGNQVTGKGGDGGDGMCRVTTW